MYIVGVSVSSVSVKDYFQILEDTLIGRFVPSFQKKPKRRVISAPKFYYFDIGIDNFLLKRGRIGDITVLPWNQFLKKLWAGESI